MFGGAGASASYRDIVIQREIFLDRTESGRCRSPSLTFPLNSRRQSPFSTCKEPFKRGKGGNSRLVSWIFLLAQVSQVSCSMYLPVMLVSPSFESLVNPATEETVAGVAVGSADGGPSGVGGAPGVQPSWQVPFNRMGGLAGDLIVINGRGPVWPAPQRSVVLPIICPPNPFGTICLLTCRSRVFQRGNIVTFCHRTTAARQREMRSAPHSRGS